MNDIFEGTGVKRYALRVWQDGQWEYPTSLEYDTAAEAQAALKGLELTRKYELVEKLPTLRYVPGKASGHGLVVNLLAAIGIKPYILQTQPVPGEWVNCYDRQFDTLEEAQAAAGSTYRAAGAVFADFLYEPVRLYKPVRED